MKVKTTTWKCLPARTGRAAPRRGCRRPRQKPSVAYYRFSTTPWGGLRLDQRKKLSDAELAELLHDPGSKSTS